MSGALWSPRHTRSPSHSLWSIPCLSSRLLLSRPISSISPRPSPLSHPPLYLSSPLSSLLPSPFSSSLLVSPPVPSHLLPAPLTANTDSLINRVHDSRAHKVTYLATTKRCTSAAASAARYSTAAVRWPRCDHNLSMAPLPSPFSSLCTICPLFPSLLLLRPLPRCQSKTFGLPTLIPWHV